MLSQDISVAGRPKIDIAAVALAATLTLLFRFTTGSWAHPAALFAGYWTVVQILTVLSTSLDDATQALWYIVACIVACTASTALLPESRRNKINQRRTIHADARLRFLVAASAVSTFLAALILQRANGIPYSASLSFESLAEGARVITSLRYHRTIDGPVSHAILLGFGYMGAFLSPFAASQLGNLKKLLVILAPVVASAWYALATTARAPLLITISITSASAIVVWAIQSSGFPGVSMRVIGVLVGSATVAVALFVVTSFIRIGRLDPQAIEHVTDRIGVYTIGSVVGLNKAMVDESPFLMGRESLAGLLGPLFGDLSLGTAQDSYVHIGDGLATNVFTAHWQLILDYGLVGSIAAIGFLVFLAALAFKIMIDRLSIIAAGALSCLLAYFLFGIAESIYMFTNVCFGIGLGWLLLVACVRVVRLSTDSVLATVPRPTNVDSSRTRRHPLRGTPEQWM